MLARFAELGIRFPRRVLAVAVLGLVAAAAFGIPVVGHLSAGGFADPGAPSTAANRLLDERFDAGRGNLVFEVTAPGGADSRAARAEGRRLVAALRRQPHINQVSSYWTAAPQVAPALRSQDGRHALVVAGVTGDDDQAPKRAAAVADTVLGGGNPDVTVTVGGRAMAYHEVTTRTTEDLVTAEAIAVPVTALLLMWVFGSVVAALLPLLVGLVAMLGTLAILRGLTLLTDVSIYALNVTTALGLALAIDYSLLIISRYREQLRSGSDRPAAVRRAMATAGRTVAFSAVTVALSLAALLVFPLYFLRSFAYAGVAVVALAALAALVLLPAVLTVLGPRIDALDMRTLLRRQPRHKRGVPLERSFWYRVATVVMRRPVLIGLTVTALVLLLATPFLGVRFGYPDSRVLPASAPAHIVGDSLRSDYESNAAATLRVVLPNTASGTNQYARQLSTLDGVTAVRAPDGTFTDGHRAGPGDPRMSRQNSSYLTIRSTVEPMSQTGLRLLSSVPATEAPGRTLITGTAAQNADSVAAIGTRLPLALAWIIATTFCLLFLFTGSIVVPLKALVLNALSLSATFGAMVWIFQDGHLIELFGSTTSGYLVVTMPVLMFCLAFGTSMDYEVFLLSRIREQWLASARTSADNTHAVARGLASTGRIVTASALLMAIVFAALATGDVRVMQMLGTGLALAVLLDATVVRGLLVPAFMRLAGRANWWAPPALARWHARHGQSESGPEPHAPPHTQAGGGRH